MYLDKLKSGDVCFDQTNQKWVFQFSDPYGTFIFFNTDQQQLQCNGNVAESSGNWTVVLQQRPTGFGGISHWNPIPRRQQQDLGLGRDLETTLLISMSSPGRQPPK